MRVFPRLLRLCRRELALLASDPRLLAIVLFTPLAYTLLFGYLYLPKRVLHIPTWIIDEDHSALSRSLITAARNDEYFHVIRVGGTVEEFREATLNGSAYACLVIPKDFERDVKRAKSVRLLTLVEGGNMIIANSVRGGAAEIDGVYGAVVQMQRLAMRGTPSQYALSAAVPLESDIRIWNNPTFNYMDFLLPGLVGTIVQQVTLLAVALAFVRERELGLLDGLRRITSSPLEALFAKGLVYTLVNLLVAAAAYAINFFAFGVQMTGSFPLLALLLAVFISALVALGIIISALAKDQLFATQILMLIAVPSFLISGFTWPQMAMPKAILWLSNALPLTHFVLPLRQILMQNADFNNIRPHLLWLWALVCVSYLGAYLVIRHAMASSRNPEQRKISLPL